MSQTWVGAVNPAMEAAVIPMLGVAANHWRAFVVKAPIPVSPAKGRMLEMVGFLLNL